MSRQIQIRRGTAAEHENFTGAVGEITMDTTNNTLRVHDGQTRGGTPLAKQSDVSDMSGVALRLTPDWGAGVVKSTTFTADKYGVIIIRCSQAAYSKITLTINGTRIFNLVPDGPGQYQILYAGPFPVAPNDTIVVTGANSPVPTFYPYRTV